MRWQEHHSKGRNKAHQKFEPYLATTESILRQFKIPKNHLETQDDRVQEIKNIAKVINTKSDSGGWWHQSYVEATQAELFVVYWDETEKKDVSKRVAVNSSGETGLVHDETDENIKQFFREIKLMKARGDEERDDSESKDAATQAA